MDYAHLSPEMYLLTDDDRTLMFPRRVTDEKKKPLPEDCKGKLKGICFAYAFCGEQDFGIEPMAKAFGATGDKSIITKVPIEVIEFQKAKALNFGSEVSMDEQIVKEIKKSGLIGYWDDENLFVGAAPEYGFLTEAILDLTRLHCARFAFSRAGMGRHNLLILREA